RAAARPRHRSIPTTSGSTALVRHPALVRPCPCSAPPDSCHASSMPDADPWPGPDPRALRRKDFPVLRPVPLRWNDDDAYGHVNNAVHYLLFDTAVNGWLTEVVGDVRALPALGVVAETACRYLDELRFPDAVTAGLGLE